MADGLRRFRVRLESPDLARDDGSPHFRVTTLLAADEAEARRLCERRELKIAAFEHPPGVVADLEAQEGAAQDAAYTFVRSRVDAAQQAADAAHAAIETLEKVQGQKQPAPERLQEAADAVASAQAAADQAVAAAQDAEGELDRRARAPAQVRMMLATHRQQRPYEVVDVQEVV